MTHEKSCGTVLYTTDNGAIKYLLIRSPDTGYTGFPKGHVEKGETEIETALRETWEETAITAEIVSGRSWEVSYVINGRISKNVVYFPAKYDRQTPHCNPGFEKNEFLLLPFDEAYAALTYDNVKWVLEMADKFLREELNAGA